MPTLAQKPTPVGADEAAAFLGLKHAGTLANWRHRGKGPPYLKLSSRKVVYDPIDLLRWRDMQRVVPE